MHPICNPQCFRFNKLKHLIVVWLFVRVGWWDRSGALKFADRIGEDNANEVCFWERLNGDLSTVANGTADWGLENKSMEFVLC